MKPNWVNKGTNAGLFILEFLRTREMRYSFYTEFTSVSYFRHTVFSVY